MCSFPWNTLDKNSRGDRITITPNQILAPINQNMFKETTWNNHQRLSKNSKLIESTNLLKYTFCTVQWGEATGQDKETTTSFYVQHLQLWQVDVHGILSPTTVHLARALEDYWHSIYVQCHCEYPMPDRIHMHWSIVVPSLPKLSIWKWLCHLHEEIPLAEQGHKVAGSHQHGSRNSQAQVAPYHMLQTSYGMAITAKKYCVKPACTHLSVHNSLI